MIEQIPIGEEPLQNLMLFKDIIYSSLTQGAVGVFIGVYLVGNNLMISSYGTQATAAASIVSTLQSVIVSPTVGFLAATGTRLGAAKKQTDHQRQKKDEEGIIKIALLSCVVLGICNSAIFLATKPIAPMWFDKEHSETAKYVSGFFVPLSLSFSTIVYLLVQTNSVILLQLRQQNKTDYLFSTTVFYRIVSILASYGLSRKFGYSGIGMGSASAAWLTFILFQYQFLKETYSTYQLNNLLNIPYSYQIFCDFIQDGWQLALQRTTEWGNLFAITAIIGHFSPDELVAVEPSIQAMVFCNLFTQGIAQGLMYESTNNRAAKEKSGTSLVQYDFLLSKDKRIFIIGNSLGFVAATINALILALLRNKIINLFLNDNHELLNKNPEQIKLANTILLLSAFSLIPDSVRQISGGILRGWGLEAMHHSTKNNLLLMTGAGVPLALLWGYFLNDGNYAIPLFAFRSITIVASSLSNIIYFKKIYAKTVQDRSLLSSTSIFKSNHSTTRNTESTHLMRQVNNSSPQTVLQCLNYQQILDLESGSNQGAYI